ncbi:MAG: hypothetical protein OXF08_01265 [Bacteroidetes bacterium]|nr:hypothetical protein [Bacteroidota bacterium]
MNETLLYIIMGVMYLIFTIVSRLAKKKQQTSNNQEPWSLEDALADLQGYTEEQPKTNPIPESSAQLDDFSEQQMIQNYEPIYDSPQFTEIAKIPTSPIPANPTPTVKPAPVVKSHLHTRKNKTPFMIAEQFKNAKSAQTAIILSEVLGTPKGARRLPGRNRRQ